MFNQILISLFALFHTIFGQAYYIGTSDSFSTSSTTAYNNYDIICTDPDSSCTITCSGTTSCRNTRIYCPSGAGNCNVNCDGQESCFNATIYGGSDSSVSGYLRVWWVLLDSLDVLIVLCFF